jgi:hypothetical protein
VLRSRLILFDLTFSLVPGPLFILASVAFKVSALGSSLFKEQLDYVLSSGSDSILNWSGQELSPKQYPF